MPASSIDAQAASSSPQNGENAAAETTAADKKSSPTTESGSNTKTSVETPVGSLEDDQFVDAAEQLEAEEEGETSEEERGVKQDRASATVHINQDARNISLSAGNYDQTLIKYLHEHPLTSTFVCSASSFANSIVRFCSSAQLESPLGIVDPFEETSAGASDDEAAARSSGTARSSRQGSIADEKQLQDLLDVSVGRLVDRFQRLFAAKAVVEKYGCKNGDRKRWSGFRQHCALHRADGRAHRLCRQAKALARRNSRLLRGGASHAKGLTRSRDSCALIFGDCRRPKSSKTR